MERRVLIYVPEGARASTAGVYVLGDNKVTAQHLLEESNWSELAEVNVL